MARSIRSRAGTFFLLLAILLTSFAPGFERVAARAPVEGMAYTSPSFGYSIGWESPWYVTLEETEVPETDYLVLSDGESTVYFTGKRAGENTLADELDVLVEGVLSYEDVGELEPIEDGDCPAAGPQAVTACYQAVQRWDDGSELVLGILLKAWDLGDGVHLLMDAYVAENSLHAYLKEWDMFEIARPGEPLPASASGCDAVTTAAATFCFEPDVSERDRGDILEGARLGHELIARYFGEPDVGVVRVNGYSATRYDNLATTLDRTIVIYTDSSRWQTISPIERVLTVVHEYFHVYQNVAKGENWGSVPAWFNEGSAEAVGYFAASTLGTTDQAEIYDFVSYSLTVYPVTRSLSELHGYDVMLSEAYPLAYLAVQYLLGSRGMTVASLGDVYLAMGEGATFERAFDEVFGSSLADFEAEFDEWRSAFPRQVFDAGDFTLIRERDAPGAPVAPELVPDEIALGGQLLVVARTEPRTDCVAVLRLADETVRRETFSNAEGDLFWLITIPETAPTGPATVWLGCGAAPARAEVVIT